MFQSHICTCVGASICIKIIRSAASDPHPACVKFCSQKCDESNKSDVCIIWDEDQWHRYLEFEKKQEIKRKRKSELSLVKKDATGYFLFRVLTIGPRVYC